MALEFLILGEFEPGWLLRCTNDMTTTSYEMYMTIIIIFVFNIALFMSSVSFWLTKSACCA
jgi:hypothetical protein